MQKCLPLLLMLLCMGMVDLTDSFHSMLVLGSELSRELLPLSRDNPPVYRLLPPVSP